VARKVVRGCARGTGLSQDNCTIVRLFIEESINQGRIDEASQFAWEDVVEQVPFPGQGPGVEGLKDLLRGMRTAFPDLFFGVEEQIAEADKVLPALSGREPIEANSWECLRRDGR
jgi:predicted ester cyclase